MRQPSSPVNQRKSHCTMVKTNNTTNKKNVIAFIFIMYVLPVVYMVLVTSLPCDVFFF